MSELYIPSEIDGADCVAHCNGCGARDGINVPDALLGLSIKTSCNIHDYMYTYSFDKDLSDSKFLHNMKWQIDQGSKWLKYPRIVLAYGYYGAVKYFGDKAYNKGMSNEK